MFESRTARAVAVFVTELPPGARQILGHADIDKVAIEGEAAQLPLAGKQRQHIALQRAALAQMIEQRSPKRIDAAADRARPGLRWPLGEFGDPVPLHPDAAVTRGIGDLAQRHHADCRWIAEQPLAEALNRDVEPGIAIEQIKRLIKAVARMPQRAAGARGVRLGRDLDRQTEARLYRRRRRVIGNALRHKPGQQQQLSHTRLPERLQQDIEKRPLTDRQ